MHGGKRGNFMAVNAPGDNEATKRRSDEATKRRSDEATKRRSDEATKRRSIILE
jgi:hypothetical protein